MLSKEVPLAVPPPDGQELRLRGTVVRGHDAAEGRYRVNLGETSGRELREITSPRVSGSEARQ